MQCPYFSIEKVASRHRLPKFPPRTQTRDERGEQEPAPGTPRVKNGCTNAGNHFPKRSVLGWFRSSLRLLRGGFMARPKCVFGILVALAVLAGTAIAQDEDAISPPNEVSGVLGRTFLHDPHVPSFDSDVHLDNGISFELGYGYRIRENELYSLSGEVPVLFLPHERVRFIDNITPDSYRSYLVTPSLRANFLPRTYLSPWGSAGVGIGHFTSGSNLELGSGPNPGERASTGVVIQFGVGLDVRVTRRLALRTEIRDYWSGVPQLNVDTGKSRQNNLFIGSGVIWHFR
jgi:hypothetical protein